MEKNISNIAVDSYKYNQEIIYDEVLQLVNFEMNRKTQSGAVEHFQKMIQAVA